MKTYTIEMVDGQYSVSDGIFPAFTIFPTFEEAEKECLESQARECQLEMDRIHSELLEKGYREQNEEEYDYLL